MEELRPRVAAIKRELKTIGVRYWEPPECQYGMVTNYGGVRNYLLLSGASINSTSSKIRSLIYNAMNFSNKNINGYHKKRLLAVLPFLSIFQKKRSAG